MNNPELVAFLHAYPSYPTTHIIDDLRATEYAAPRCGRAYVSRLHRRRIVCRSAGTASSQIIERACLRQSAFIQSDFARRHTVGRTCA